MANPPFSARLAIAIGSSLLPACASATEGGADLPGDWQGAERIPDLTQHACDHSAYEGRPETIDASAAKGNIAVEYGDAHFRCAQDVEGFLRRNNGTLRVLVQPIDMNPSSVARCDCLYDISLSISARAGSYDLTLYRRWDNLNKPNDPVQIGTTKVVVE